MLRSSPFCCGLRIPVRPHSGAGLNIDIERTYGGAQKQLVARTPLQWTAKDGDKAEPEVRNEEDDSITPGATDGKLAKWD